jgi:hypothetical protein
MKISSILGTLLLVIIMSISNLNQDEISKKNSAYFTRVLPDYQATIERLLY